MTRLPYEKSDGDLTDAEVDKLTRTALMQSAHHLWEAEQYMMDLDRLISWPWTVEAHIAQVTSARAYVDSLLGSSWWRRASAEAQIRAKEQRSQGSNREVLPA